MNDLLTTWKHEHWPIIKSTPALELGEGVIDEGTFNSIEVDKLFESINYASTTIGQAVLFRSLARPLSDIAEIQTKQSAVEELRSHVALRDGLEKVIEQAASHESNFYLLLFGEFHSSLGSMQDVHEIDGYGYRHYRKGVQLLIDLVDQIQSLDKPQSPYLSQLFERITQFSETHAYSLMKGPVFITENGIQCKQERSDSWLPAIIFIPRIIKPILLGAIFASIWLVSHFAPEAVLVEIPDEAIFLTPFSLLYFPLVGGFDRDHCMMPLRNLYKNSEAVADTLDALGQLDELLSFLKFADHFGHQTVLPTLVEGHHHRLNLTDAKNPVLAKTRLDYVGNDLVLDDEKLLLVTGPNSGGKTALCKTVTQIQVLAQIGCFVPAYSATLTVADKVFYQAPEISHLNDGEGRFGTELKRTKDIFLATTAKSLIVLDEMSEGTTFEEKMESSANVLNGFYRKGNSTILITHNHQLVDMFVKQRTGVAKQVEFANDAPTYKIIPGISRVSHADRVAKKIGFSKEDIDHYLEDSQ